MRKFTLFILLGILIGGPIYIYKSKNFERNKPVVTTNHSKFWNLRDDLNFSIQDESGLKYSKVTIINNNQSYVIYKNNNVSKKKIENIHIKIPRQYPISGNKLKVIVEATDNSKWNFFAGNDVKKEFNFIIDTKFPEAEIVSNTYDIKQGGSAIVIVKAKDKNLKTAYIEVNGHIKFKLTKFFKPNYYISLLAFPYYDKSFVAYLVVEDKAGNIVKRKIHIYYKNVRFKIVKLKISANFINNIDRRVLEKMNMEIPDSNKAIFIDVNKKVRKINEDSLYKASNVILENKIDEFKILPFRPMKGATKEAGYGDIRHYFYNGQQIDTEVHKGFDLASYRHVKLYSSNPGKVIYKQYTGIYGNTLLIYHKLGLVTGYSHTSNILVNVGDRVKRGEVVAISGSTGAVFGDHLHFGVFIQGIPVTPIEWMDKSWIKTRIEDIINNAKRLINQ